MEELLFTYKSDKTQIIGANVRVIPLPGVFNFCVDVQLHLRVLTGE